MDEAYRDKAAAALARVEALERENRELRTKNAELEARVRAFEHASERVPEKRHSGPMVVGWLVLTLGAILGASLFMMSQIHSSPPPMPHWTPPPPMQIAPAVPSAPPVPVAPPPVLAH